MSRKVTLHYGAIAEVDRYNRTEVELEFYDGHTDSYFYIYLTRQDVDKLAALLKEASDE